MEELAKKLKALIKAIKTSNPQIKAPIAATIPPIKPISPPPMTVSHAPTNIPKPGPDSKKDPKKIAQQIKDGSMSTKTQKTLGQVSKSEILKFNKSGQWSLDKADPDFRIPKKITNSLPPLDPSHPTKVHAEHHGFGGLMNEAHPDQKKLIHGIDLASGTPEESGTTEGSSWVSNPSNKSMIIKPASGAEEGNREHQDEIGLNKPDRLNSARREVLFHNMAHHLGLGNYVPTTAGFEKNGEDYSAQEKVDGTNTRFLHYSKHKHYKQALKDMHDSGDLHKMAIFDMLMGNNDRHKGNVMLNSKEPKLHMIDNGRSIDYRNDEPNAPSYLRDAEEHLGSSAIHPKAAEWLNSLSKEDVTNMLDKYVEPNSGFKQHFLKRLDKVKKALDYFPDDGSVKLSHVLRLVGEASAKDRSKLAASIEEQSDLKKYNTLREEET